MFFFSLNLLFSWVKGYVVYHKGSAFWLSVEGPGFYVEGSKKCDNVNDNDNDNDNEIIIIITIKILKKTTQLLNLQDMFRILSIHLQLRDVYK